MLNKALKLTVISAVLITSGFTQQQATISGDVTNNDTFEIGNGVTVAMADGATIHNYGNIKGSGEIDGTAEATIINYNHIVEVTENDPNCFRPTGGGSVEGTINTGDVTVTDQKADIIVSFDESNKSGNTILLTTDICDADTDKVLNLTNDGDAITVNANIANELNGSGVSHSLNIQGKFVLTGDQSHFNQDGTTWNVNGGSSSIAATNAFPQTEVNVNDGSELNINASGIVTASKDVTVNGSQLNISKNSRFKLDKGVTLWFKAPVLPTVYTWPYENPTQMTWNQGEFTGTLTEMTRRWYNVTLDDGVTDMNFYVENSIDNVKMLFYPENTELYEIRYIIDMENNKVIWILDLYDSARLLKTITKTELDSMTPFKSETLYHDGVFSYNKEGNTWTRQAQYMIKQTINHGEIRAIFKLSKDYPYGPDKKLLSFMVLHPGGVFGAYLNGDEFVQLTPCIDQLEGNGTTGGWLDGNRYNEDFSKALQELDAWVRTHTFEETWCELSAYNTKNNTDYRLPMGL